MWSSEVSSAKYVCMLERSASLLVWSTYDVYYVCITTIVDDDNSGEWTVIIDIRQYKCNSHLQGRKVAVSSELMSWFFSLHIY